MIQASDDFYNVEITSYMIMHQFILFNANLQNLSLCQNFDEIYSINIILA